LDDQIKQQTSIKQSINTKIFFVLTVTLTLVFGATFYFLSGQQYKIVMQQSQTGAEETAYALLASLETLMLAGDGNLAHDCLKGFAKSPKLNR